MDMTMSSARPNRVEVVCAQPSKPDRSMPHRQLSKQPHLLNHFDRAQRLRP